jgi:hypothetical protein
MILSDGHPVDFAPQMLGETVPMLANGYFYASDGLDLSGRFATYAALYRAQPSIATLVDKIANSAARLTLKVWDTTPATGKVQDVTSPYARLMDARQTFMSPFNFWRWTFSTYEVYGEAFWLKQRDDAGRRAVAAADAPVAGDGEARRGRERQVRLHAGRRLGRTPRGAASEVVPFLRYNPDS